VADRINLGLIPSSELGWPVAAKALSPKGGWLHIHGNVSETPQDIENWKALIIERFHEYLPNWIIEVKLITKVKSYAPKILHLVADVHCLPK